MSRSDTRTLTQRILRAGGWTIVGLGLGHILRFGSNLIMTRMLAPDLFGIVAVASIILTGFAMMSDVGLQQNIVQSSDGRSKTFLNTVWSVQIIRGILICMLTLLASLLVAVAQRWGMVPITSVYAAPILPYVIAAISVNALIGGFDSTKLAEASRSLSLRRVILIDLASQVLGLAIMISWAYVNRTIWALVVGGVFSASLRMVLSHRCLPGVANQWHWDSQALRAIIRFGSWLFLSSIFGFVVLNGDKLLLGFFVSATVLGVYIIAFQLCFTVEQVLGKIMGDASFAAFSEVARERPADLQRSYYRMHSVIASCAYFFAGILIFAGQDLVTFLYDSRYSEAGWMLEMLALCLFGIPLRLAGQCFIALGLPRLFALNIWIHMVALLVLLPLGFQFFGIQGAILGIVVSYFSMLPTTIYYMIKHGLFSLWNEVKPISAAVMGILMVKGVKYFFGV